MQGKYTGAAEIEREVLVSLSRLLGAEHEETLISASNLAVSLSNSGHEMECEKALRETLALSRRVHSPTHEIAQHLLQGLRAIGLAAR